MTKLYDKVKSILLDGLADYATKEEPINLALLYKLYEQGDFYLSVAEAEEVASELDIWECVGVVQVYETERYDKVYTPLCYPTAVVNMVVYIMGINLLDAIYGNTIPEEGATAKELLSIAEKWFDENPEGLDKIWLDLPAVA